MAAFRATIVTAGAASLLLCNAPASAQIDEAAVNILRECARIDDPTARLACYDNNIRGVGGMARSTIPGQSPRPEGGAAPVGASSPQGFGSESVRTAQRSERTAGGQLNEIMARVTAIRPREPGIYLITLEDGAQWQFADGVSNSYRLPRSGSVVEIQRGSLGSFLMRYDGQAAVPMRRVR